MTDVKNKVCLIVIDGWGKSEETHGNAIYHAVTPCMDALESGDNIYLDASEEHVGVPEGQMGNSEVGHLNIGAGRVVYQDIVRINQSIRDHTLIKNQVLVDMCQNAIKNSDSRIHLLGLVSDGGVHSHINHILALVDCCKELGVKHCYLHFFSDGRDTSPTSGVTYISKVLESFKENSYGELATVVGRYYAMDRDKRWERIKVAYDALVNASGDHSSLDKLIEVVKQRYSSGETDEFLKPIIMSDVSRIRDNDTMVFMNFRSDRMRQIVSAFGIEGTPVEPEVKAKNLKIACMTQYNAEFSKYFPTLFPPISMKNVLAEWLSLHKINQIHIAETEKYAHVTFFFNGGKEIQFPQEDRILVPSPKVPTYDQKPEMSVLEVADEVIKSIKSDKYQFVMCNLAPPDMVGHTGVYEAAVTACSATDIAIKRILDACKEHNFILCVTADHGNAEKMYGPNDSPFTAHTLYKVPFCISNGIKMKECTERSPALRDVAVTVLDILGLEPSPEMTGISLLQK